MIIGITGILASGQSLMDANARAFLNTQTSPTLTQQNAIVALVAALKSTSSTFGGTLWDRSDNIKPFLGIDAVSDQYNLKNIALHLEVFHGVINHNSYGIGCARAAPNYTFSDYTPALYGTVADGFGISQYSQAGSFPTGHPYGATSSSLSAYCDLWSSGYAELAQSSLFLGFNLTLGSNYHMSLNGSTGIKLYRNTTLLGSGGSTNTALTNKYLYQFNYGIDNASSNYNDSGIISHLICGRFSPTDMLNINTIMQAFHTSLSRAV